jgi:hypothetical protein
LFLLFLVIELILLGLMFAHSSFQARREDPFRKARTEMVRRLGLTDLCLFTEASYTRHLTQTDLHTPFQDSPTSPDPFPSGSILRPPLVLRRSNALLD